MLSVGCSPIVPPPSSYITIKKMEGLLGFAVWDCSEPYATAWVRVYLRGEQLAGFGEGDVFWISQSLKETIGHELTHVRQQQSGTCERWVELQRDPANRTQWEYEAECAGRAIVGRPCQ